VRNNVAVILVKLQLHDRAAAVAKARDAGLGKQQLPSPAGRSDSGD
jgi:hypothetical protein